MDGSRNLLLCRANQQTELHLHQHHIMLFVAAKLTHVGLGAQPSKLCVNCQAPMVLGILHSLTWPAMSTCNMPGALPQGPRDSHQLHRRRTFAGHAGP